MSTLVAFLFGAIALGFITSGDRPRRIWTLVLVVAAFVIAATYMQLGTI
jgi:hypothetical protein